MTAFAIKGRISGHPVEAEWTDGSCVMDDALRRGVEWIVGTQVSVDATPTGPFFVPGLGGHEQAFATIVAALDQLDGATGDVPRYGHAADVVA